MTDYQKGYLEGLAAARMVIREQEVYTQNWPSPGFLYKEKPADVISKLIEYSRGKFNAQ